MDEVDGMSAGDRGGVTALVALIKKTKVSYPRLHYFILMLKSILQIPIICIANDKGTLKLKSLVNTAYNLSFRRCVEHYFGQDAPDVVRPLGQMPLRFGREC